MTVVLDTTVYHADPFLKSTDMVKFRQLCNEGKIRLIIPQIVYSEYKSQEEEKFINLAKQFLAKVTTRSRKSTYASEKILLNELQDDATKIIEKSEKSIDEKINSFLSETKAKVKKITLDEFNEAFSRYFSGDKPFLEIKSRKDIPDSLTFVQVKNMKSDEVIFISDDNNLRESIKDIGITTYSKLSDFIRSDIIKEIVDYKSTDEFLCKYFITHFSDKNYKIIELITKALEEDLYNKQFNDKEIPDDNYEGTISSINDIKDIKFTCDDIISLGNGMFSISFSCKLNANIEYFIFKADYYCLDESRIKYISIDDWNKHYYHAEEELNLSCTGTIGLQYDIQMSDIAEFAKLKIEDFVEEINLSFSDLEIEVISNFT